MPILTRAHRFAFALFTLLAACGGSQHTGSGSTAPAGNAPGELTLDPATVETITEADRVSANDAAVPDHRPDARFTAHVRGKINALILTICEDNGENTGTQWDTIVGQQPIPEGFVYRHGVDTWVLGVVDEHGHMLNHGDGTLPETTFAQSTALTLYASMRETLVAGRNVCLTALRPDGPPLHATAVLR